MSGNVRVLAPRETAYKDFAKRYFELGIVPIPTTRADQKVTASTWAQYQAGMPAEDLDRMIDKYTNHGIGGVCPIGSPYFVLDLDDGAYTEMHEHYGFELPKNTPVVRSGGVSANGKRDKYHIYYKKGRYANIVKNTKEEDTAFFSTAKVGVRADKLFIVLPPTMHTSGNRYEWLAGQAPWEMDMTEPDEIVVTMLLGVANKSKEEFKPSFIRHTERELRRMVKGDSRNDYVSGLLLWVKNQRLLGFDPTSPDRALLFAYAEMTNNKFAEPMKDDELGKVVNSALKKWESLTSAESITSVMVNGKSYEISEVGIAERLSVATCDKMRYSVNRKAWLAYDGRYWASEEKGDTSGILSALRPLCRALPAEANSIPDEDQRSAVRKKLVKLSADMGSVSRQASIASYAAGMCRVDSRELDAVPDILNLQNGTLSLSDYTLRPHAPADMLTKIAEVAYDPEALCPRWESFMLESLEGDAERVAYLQRTLGYALTDNCGRQQFFILQGEGNNGKSVIVTVIGRILGLLGDGYGYPAKITSFLATRGTDDKLGNDILDMAGCRFAFAEEPRKNVRFNTGLIKDLAAGGVQSGRRLHENLTRFEFRAKLFFVCNHLPILDDTGKGIERRVIVIPFGKGIDDSAIDIYLPDKLMEEAPGILNWLLAGHRALVSGGTMSLRTSSCPAVLEATRHYIKDNDLLGQFIEDCCAVDTTARTGSTLFRSAFEAWLTENAFDRIQTDARQVANDMTVKGFHAIKSNGTMHFIGISVTDDWAKRGETVSMRRSHPTEF